MNRNIVVLAGAGASFAVDQQSYPTTQGFFERLETSLKANKFLDRVIRHLRKNQPVVDVETLLWALGDIEMFWKSALDTASPIGAMLADDSMGITVNTAGYNAHVLHLARAVNGQIPTLITQLNERLYELYANEPSEDQLINNWIPLLRGLCARSTAVQVATTNYDLVLENAIEAAQVPISLGVSKSHGRRRMFLATEQYNSTSPSDTPRSVLGKLHGSLDWVRKEEKIEVGDPSFHGDHGRHAIIYPGFKGAPQHEPFISLHEWFGRALATADVLVVIGFAFRDEYLNIIMRESLNPRANVIVIDPAKVNVPLRHADHHHIALGFGIEAVNAALKHADESPS